MRKLLLIFIGIFILSSCSDNTPQKTGESDHKQKKEIDLIKRSDIEILTDSLKIDSLNPELYIQRARINLAAEQISSAIGDINSALSINRKNVDALLVLADIYYSLGDDDNILLTLNKACEYAPFDPRPVVKLSELSFLQGNIRLSDAYIDKALELDRFNPQAYFMRGMISLSKNDTLNAVKNFMIARNQQNDFIDPIIQIAHIYMAQKNPLAEDFFREAVSIVPENYSIYYDYAMYLQDNGKPEEALSVYDTLLKISPENTNFIYNKGYVYLVYLGDNEKALECFNKVLELDPSSVDALFNKGRTCEQMGDYINAKSIYRQILKKNPDYQLAIDAVRRIEE